MRKIIFIIITTILLLISSVNTFAADVLYRMLHADEVESLKKDQDAIVVGELIEKQGDKFRLRVSKVISGKVTSDTILLSYDFDYTFEEKEPCVNDFGIYSIKKVGNYYKKAWQAYRTDSLDYNTLKVIIVKEDKLSYLGDAACVEWYVNSGGKDKDFSFSGGNAYVKGLNGEVIQVYPKLNGGYKAQDKTTTVQSNKNKSEDNLTEGDKGKNYVVFIILLFAALGAQFVNMKKGRKV